jgi:acyl-CoA synthetase (AMP-forming)/AMP-acid ligase II
MNTLTRGQVTKAALLELYEKSVPRWSIPDDIIFVASLPVLPNP